MATSRRQRPGRALERLRCNHIRSWPSAARNTPKLKRMEPVWRGGIAVLERRKYAMNDGLTAIGAVVFLVASGESEDEGEAEGFLLGFFCPGVKRETRGDHGSCYGEVKERLSLVDVYPRVTSSLSPPVRAFLGEVGWSCGGRGELNYLPLLGLAIIQMPLLELQFVSTLKWCFLNNLLILSM